MPEEPAPKELETMDKINALIADKNFGGAWQAAEDFTGEHMSYIDFLGRFVWATK